MLIIPTSNLNAFVLHATLPLLRRYWPGHPSAHVLHYETRPNISAPNVTWHDRGAQADQSWLTTMTAFLAGRREELFVLLLDDYGLCGPARVDWIDAGIELMRRDPLVGLFPLCWYPASRRVAVNDTAGSAAFSPSPGTPGEGRGEGGTVSGREKVENGENRCLLSTLDSLRAPSGPLPNPLPEYRAREQTTPPMVTSIGAPILLQAAIWRRSYFLELSNAIGGRATPWGFEAGASRWARKFPHSICTIDIPEPAYFGGDLVDGFDKANWPLPYHNLLHRGEPVPAHERFLDSQGLSLPIRGLGDALARVTRATGIDRAAQAVADRLGRDCGCQKRRRWLNERFGMLDEAKMTKFE